MANSVLVPVSEYLSNTYHPDCDYVDGELKERNVGEEPHSELQAILTRILGNRRKEWGIRVLTEQRVQTSESHYRIPDICVVRSTEPKGLIIRYAPLLCIEVLSYEDRFAALQEKVNDFAELGVKDIWAIDPWKQLGYYASPRGFEQPVDGILRVAGTPIEISLADIFAELDEG
jgi:Uma2 family endonuclease